MASSCRELSASSNVKKKVCFMSENHAYNPVLMISKEHFRMRRLRSRGMPQGHGYCCAGSARSLLNKCFRILGWCTREIMMFYFCSVILW